MDEFAVCVKARCRGSRDSSGFRHQLQLMCCTTTNSVQVFQGGSNLWSWVNSGSSLRTEQVMKLGKVWPSGSAFRWDEEARFSSMVVTGASRVSR